MVRHRKVIYQDTKLKWPFKLLLVFVGLCLVGVVFSFVQSKYALLAHGENGRGTISSEEYVGTHGGHETTRVIVNEPVKYEGQGFINYKFFLDVTVITRHVSAGQNVPVIIYQDENSLQGFVGTKTDVLLSIISPVVLIVALPVYFIYKYRRKKIAAF